MRLPHALCHDQECLDGTEFALTSHKWGDKGKKWYPAARPYPWFKMKTDLPYQLYNHVILVHSERNSEMIARAEQSGYIPVHWLCHAMVSLDWYRYAKHDPMLKVVCDHKPNIFLIYNRAWTGSREYRLKFAEMLVDARLLDSSVTSLAFVDQNVHYSDHPVTNQIWQTNTEFEKFFRPNTSPSSASADYTHTDYSSAAIEVVLETWFDSEKNHLTEKTFRPLAVGQPFMLVSTAHSLAYLRSYGFETFAPWINETYDTITDPWVRMQAIILEMKRLQKLNRDDFHSVIKNCNRIAQRNKARFFSPEFEQQVIDELREGMISAIAQCRAGASMDHYEMWAQDQPDPPDISQIARELELL